MLSAALTLLFAGGATAAPADVDPFEYAQAENFVAEDLNYLKDSLGPEKFAGEMRRLSRHAVDAALRPTNVRRSLAEEAGWASQMPNFLPDPQASTTGPCTDPLSDAALGSAPCSYSCDALAQHYFGGSNGTDGMITRCFIYDTQTGSWPSSLMERKQTTLDWENFLAPTQAVPAQFTLGAGPVCQNVTISTANSTWSANETSCTLPGPYQYTHVEASAHSIAITGAVAPESDGLKYAGNTTAYTVGTCTEVLVRVATAATDGGSLVWTLNDGGLNGPWSFNTNGIGTYEHAFCLYDHNYTISRSGAGSWTGTVAVVSYREDNTIYIPNDEKWIIQGATTNGIPVSLDARLSSGTIYSLTNASIVLRHTRFSRQKGTPDHLIPALGHPNRAYSRPAGEYSLGGSLFYEGGRGSKLEFDHCVWDHGARPPVLEASVD